MSVAQSKHRPLAREVARVLNGAWPLPALAVWGLCWLAYGVGMPWWACTLIGGALAACLGSSWRRLWMVLGFPLSSALAVGTSTMDAWVWLLPLLVLWLLYPARRWRDAPWYPTAPQALAGLSEALPLPPEASILEAGCGLGDGLLSLRRQYPRAKLTGLEWSALLLHLCRWRMRWHGVQVQRLCRADMWQADWSGHELIYLFHRPETMAQAQRKLAGLRPGTWVVSLVFELPDWVPVRQLQAVPDRPVWIYRVPDPRGVVQPNRAR